MAGTGGTQVLRFRVRRTLDTHLVRHVEGKRRHPTTRATATVDGGPGYVDLGGVGLAAARAAVEAHWPTGRGRKPHQALDMVFAGPPPYVIPDRDQDGKVVTKKDENGEPRPLYKPNPGRWPPERELEWAKAVAATLPELVGDESVVASVTLHCDELSPHVQAVVVPVRDRKLGWCRVRDGVAARLAPEVKEARKEAVGRGEEAPQLSTRTRYGILQDALYWRVSREYGLSRGQVGSEATHVEIDRAAAAEAREGQALYEAEQARATAKEAAAAADASRRARSEHHDQAVVNLAAAREARQDRATAERERATAQTERNRAVADLAAFEARGPWVRRVRQERELRQREQADAERRTELDQQASELKERGEQVAKDAADVERREADLASGEARLEEGRAAAAAELRKAGETRETAQAAYRTVARRLEKAKELEREAKDDLEELARREAEFAVEREAFEPARRKLAAQRERARQRDEELDEWARKLDAQHDGQEKRAERQDRTADELAARKRELDVQNGRMQRQRERLLAMLLRCREKARRLRSWARELAEQARLDREVAGEEAAKAKRERADAARQLMDAQATNEQVRLDREEAAKARREALHERAEAQNAKRGAQEAESQAMALKTTATVHERQAREVIAALNEWHKRSVEWVERLKAQRREVEAERTEAGELAAATDAPKMLLRAVKWLVSQGHQALGKELFVALDPDTAQRRPAKEVIQVLALPDVELPPASTPVRPSDPGVDRGRG